MKEFRCGHPKTKENSYFHDNEGKKWSSCKTCKRAYSMEKTVIAIKYKAKFNARKNSSDVYFYKAKERYDNGKVWVISDGRVYK